jgi:hypothetical protein
MMPEQLAFPFFIGEPEPVLPRPSRYRRRLARVAAIAANATGKGPQNQSNFQYIPFPSEGSAKDGLPISIYTVPFVAVDGNEKRLAMRPADASL